jgi:two-component system chemotaxis response regulator CheB
MSDLVRVLVVDDSAYVRKVLREMLSRSPFIEVVGTARDGQEALELVAELEPDVVTCDLIMPELDGVGFIREQMARRPVPIVVVSIASESGELVLAALDAGAVDFVQKPTALATDRLLDISEELLTTVKGAAGARPMRERTGAGRAAPRREVSPAIGALPRVDLLAIAISTGGPQALRELIPTLPGSFPVPIVVVLHMPVGYTDLYARKLDDIAALSVVEAQHGQALEPGTVYIAPAGRHLSFVRALDRVLVHLDLRPLDAPYRPSADVLFQSAAHVYGSRVLAVVMTGMGADGREGAAWIKAKGGTVLTQSESSCVVYGMPRSVVEAGLSDAEIGLEEMATAILARL